MKKNLAILLPYKERYTLNDAAAASIWVKDYLKESKLSNHTLVFGNLPENKRPLTKNYINIQEMTMISNNKQIGVIIHIKIVKSSVIN